MQFIEKHMTSLLFAGCVAGLVWPYWGWASDHLVKLILIIATFIACFKLDANEFRTLKWKPLCAMIFLRYTAFAWLLYCIAGLFLPADIALAVLMIAALPAGVSSPAMTNLFGGQVTLAAIITITITLLAPFTMPFLFSFANGVTVIPKPIDLLQTLAIILLLPCAAYALLRKSVPIKTTVVKYGKATTILLVAIMLAIVIGKQRSFVLADLWLLAAMVALTFVVQSMMLISAWIAGYTQPRDQRIALTVTSGFNNAALGVAIAALHFSPLVVVVMVGAELSWALLPYVMQYLLKR